jgi:hypothetical protein
MDDPSLYKKENIFLIMGLSAAAVLLVISRGKTDNTSVAALRIAYILLFLVMVFKAIFVCSRVKINPNDEFKYSKMIRLIYPFLPILTILFIIMILLFKFYDRITGGKVSDYYTSFMNLTSILIMIQFIIIFKELTESKLTLNEKTTSVLKLLALLTLISVTIIYIVLKFYVTDG